MNRVLRSALAAGVFAFAAVAPSLALGQSEGDSEPAREERASFGDSVLEASEPARIRYFVERIEVVGNRRTLTSVVKAFVPVAPGDVLDVDDPHIEALRFRLLGTGWFNDVRLRLSRGEKRGWVVLVVEVEERNTVVISQLTLGVAEGLNSSRDRTAEVVPYGGVTVAETNLLGLGMTLSGTVLASKPQQGARLRFVNPTLFHSNYALSASLFFNNARQFFGNDDVLLGVSIRCPPEPEECPPEVEARNAVVLYRRWGGSIGTGHDLGPSTRYTLDWQGEFVNVRARPDAASQTRGSQVVPIDFAIQDGRSFVSVLRFGLSYDLRDDPALPTRGTLVNFLGDGGSRILGSDYGFLRLQSMIRHWFRLPWGHSVRLGAYGGILFGNAPFFYRFHVSDLTDLIPSRVLEMELDRRAPPNLLNTAIEVMRTGELAARIDVEYEARFYRGVGFVRTATAYVGVGLYALADTRDLSVAIPGYRGFSRLPIDLTFDLGLRADTRIGVFQFGFSNLLGFVALSL